MKKIVSRWMIGLASWLYRRFGERCPACGEHRPVYGAAGLKRCGPCHAAKHAEIDRLFWTAGAKRCTQERCNSRRVN